MITIAAFVNLKRRTSRINIVTRVLFYAPITSVIVLPTPPGVNVLMATMRTVYETITLFSIDSLLTWLRNTQNFLAVNM